MIVNRAWLDIHSHPAPWGEILEHSTQGELFRCLLLAPQPCTLPTRSKSSNVSAIEIKSHTLWNSCYSHVTWIWRQHLRACLRDNDQLARIFRRRRRDVKAVYGRTRYRWRRRACRQRNRNGYHWSSKTLYQELCMSKGHWQHLEVYSVVILIAYYGSLNILLSGRCVYQAQSSHSILSDVCCTPNRSIISSVECSQTYKRTPIHYYDPHKAPLLDHYR